MNAYALYTDSENDIYKRPLGHIGNRFIWHLLNNARLLKSFYFRSEQPPVDPLSSLYGINTQ